MVPIAVEEPTVRMTFGVNKSPLAGREGKFLTTRMIRDRLMKELDRNVALRVEETDSSDAYEVRYETGFLTGAVLRPSSCCAKIHSCSLSPKFE